ncbi:MAG TPA: hypothetical protein VF268_09700 [Gammaproteobacteria bacterium]
MKLWLHFSVAALAIPLALMFFIYPAFVIGALIFDPELKATGQSRLVPGWFESAAGRYASWADDYLDSGYAKSVEHDDVPATEWPMFGSMFFLVAANDLWKQGRLDIKQPAIRDAVDKAAQIIVSPDTATWVRTRWGHDYLHEENVFYRMLLILGLSAYQEMSGDTRHRELLRVQRLGLARELDAAPWKLLDDYPGECYPNDVLWSVAAMRRAARLDQDAGPGELADGLLAVLESPLASPLGLPAFQANCRAGTIVQNPRGSGNSAIIIFAAELDIDVAGRWYRAHETYFWKENRWVAGFTELPRGSGRKYMDVDSGPVLFEFGSAASAFGIGAAKAVGRIDHAAVLTLETVAVAWPTPFGLLLPGLMGRLSVDSWSLGEIALLFAMTRPVSTTQVVPFSGPIPWVVWLLMFMYFSAGVFFIAMEVRGCLNLAKKINHLKTGYTET